jgi:hypothetical protein
MGNHALGWVWSFRRSLITCYPLCDLVKRKNKLPREAANSLPPFRGPALAAKYNDVQLVCLQTEMREMAALLLNSGQSWRNRQAERWALFVVG